jgi:hypothetical protein
MRIDAMKLRRMLLGLTALSVLIGAALVASWMSVASEEQGAESAGDKMIGAAQKLLDSLDDKLRAKATFAFDDEKERTHWRFTPREKDKKPIRNGVSLEEMNKSQKEAALNLLRAGTSLTGYDKATTIMSLEAILRDLEKGSGPTRNPEWYFFTIFGKPTMGGKWGWRVEGHHLALNFTLDGGKVLSATPAMFGANPATVKGGDRKGLRTHPEAEDLARELFNSLNADQKKVALQPKQHPEISEAQPAPKVGEPVGLPGKQMTANQRATLLKLLQAYADRMSADIAAAKMKEVKDTGIENVYFAFWGGTEPGQAYTYRVQGPTFVVKFLNVQKDGAGNPANHIHSAWRSLKNDFGLAAK